MFAVILIAAKPRSTGVDKALFDTRCSWSDATLVQTDFLDVVLNLNNGKFSPFRKPNDNYLYINVRSNHPSTITKHLPLMIEKRISQISCNESEFHKAVPICEQTLQKHGYNVKLSFQQQPALGRERKCNRKRNIIRFNPPYDEQVKTNIGKSFFHLLQKHFPPELGLYEICNKNIIKLSYCCALTWPAVSLLLIRNYYMNLLTSRKHCLVTVEIKPPCPMSCRWREKCIVYKASINSSGKTMVYFGLCKTKFKVCY